MTTKEQEAKWTELRDGMSFRERTAWISVLTTGAVYGFYFWTVFRHGLTDGADHVGLLVGSVIVLVVLQIVLMIAMTVVAALRSPQDVSAPLDEREKLFALKASRVAYVVLSLGAASVMFTAYFGLGRLLICNGLFLALVLSEMAKSLTLIVHYRLGA
jgi:hypothetical protein